MSDYTADEIDAINTRNAEVRRVQVERASQGAPARRLGRKERQAEADRRYFANSHMTVENGHGVTAQPGQAAWQPSASPATPPASRPRRSGGWWFVIFPIGPIAYLLVRAGLSAVEATLISVLAFAVLVALMMSRHRAPAAPAPQPGTASRLATLISLHDAGTLTDAEYAAKRADLIARL